MFKQTKMNNKVNNLTEDQEDLNAVSTDLTKSVLMEHDAGVHLTFLSRTLLFIPEIYFILFYSIEN